MFRARPFLLSFQVGSDEFDAVVGEAGLELAAGVAFVSDHGLHAATVEQGRVMIEDVDRDVAFVGFRVGQRERDGQPGRGADQM